MSRRKSLRIFSAVLLCIFWFLPLCSAQEKGLEKVGSYGFIDWVGQKVLAKGIGAPPKKYFGTPQARPLAIRAASADARRNLLEVIKGIHIDATTTVENRIASDDRIVTRVKGLIKGSTIGDVQYLSDGTVEATAVISFSEGLMQVLLEQEGLKPPVEKAAGRPSPELLLRLERIEKRVKRLEDALGVMKEASLEQREMTRLIADVLALWIQNSSRIPVPVQAPGQHENLSMLLTRLDDQEKRLASLGKRLEDLSRRLQSLEKGGKPAALQKDRLPYTGLVIDARGTGFVPCLKPSLFAGGQPLYPGDYVRLKTALKRGYVRYFRDKTRAQQSEKAGKLPLTIKAKGTYEGKRNLEISEADAATLKKVIKYPDGFMSDCRVVIIF